MFVQFPDKGDGTFSNLHQVSMAWVLLSSNFECLLFRNVGNSLEFCVKYIVEVLKPLKWRTQKNLFLSAPWTKSNIYIRGSPFLRSTNYNLIYSWEAWNCLNFEFSYSKANNCFWTWQRGKRIYLRSVSSIFPWKRSMSVKKSVILLSIVPCIVFFQSVVHRLYSKRSQKEYHRPNVFRPRRRIFKTNARFCGGNFLEKAILLWRYLNTRDILSKEKVCRNNFRPIISLKK